MSLPSREQVFFAARTTIFLLIVIGGIYWFVNRPKPAQPLTEYIGDPNTGCAYTLDNERLKSLNWANPQGAVQGWDEFTSLEKAKDSGYRLCR